LREVVIVARVITVNDALDGHVVLDIECLDRVYLNAYVPILQSSGQVVAFMTQHLSMPISSPALMEKISTRFRCGGVVRVSQRYLSCPAFSGQGIYG
jgi:hypothetical protein